MCVKNSSSNNPRNRFVASPSKAKMRPLVESSPWPRTSRKAEQSALGRKTSWTKETSTKSRPPAHRVWGTVSPPHVTGRSGVIWVMTMPWAGSWLSWHSNAPLHNSKTSGACNGAQPSHSIQESSPIAGCTPAGSAHFMSVQ